MPQFNITKSHILYGLDFTENVGYVLKEFAGLIDGHVEYVSYRLSFKTYLQRFPVVSLAVTFFARHLDIRQEVHLNGLIAVAATRLATSPFHVEREASGLVATNLCLGQIDEEVSDIREYPRISSRIRTWRPTNRTLVDVHYLVYIFQSLDAFVWHRCLQRTIKMLG